jgi:glycosyltransferase involved in cell wall biosynthesis
LAKRGIPYSVQTSANQSIFPQDGALSPSTSANIKLIPTSDLRSWRASRNQQAGHLAISEKSSKTHTFFRSLYHAYPFVLFTGDGGRTYIRESVRRASQLIEAEGITHLLSSYRPWADHIVAYRLKKRYPHLVWIADFRDLPVDPVRKDVWWPGLQRWWQKRLLRQADLVTTVSDGLAHHFQKNNQKVIVVRNGLDRLPSSFLTAPTSSHFTITYTGSLYPGLQSTDSLFSVLRALIDDAELNPAHLELHYAGKDGDLWHEWATRHTLGYLTVNHDFVPLERARELQQNSQINLLLSWSAKDYGGIMTAKLGSYLMAGRPVVCLLNGPPDPELNQVVEDTGAGFVYASEDSQSLQQLRTFLLDAYRTWAFSGALPWRIDPRKLQPYTWENQLKNLLASV